MLLRTEKPATQKALARPLKGLAGPRIERTKKHSLPAAAKIRAAEVLHFM